MSKWETCILIHVWWFGYNKIKILDHAVHESPICCWCILCLFFSFLIEDLLSSLCTRAFEYDTAIATAFCSLWRTNAYILTRLTESACLQTIRPKHTTLGYFSSVQCMFLWQLDCTSVVAKLRMHGLQTQSMVWFWMEVRWCQIFQP